MKKLVRTAVVFSLAILALGCSSSDPCAEHGGVCLVGPDDGFCAGPINTNWCFVGDVPAGPYCCLPCGSDAGTSDGGACPSAN